MKLHSLKKKKIRPYCKTLACFQKRKCHQSNIQYSVYLSPVVTASKHITVSALVRDSFQQLGKARKGSLP